MTATISCRRETFVERCGWFSAATLSRSQGKYPYPSNVGKLVTGIPAPLPSRGTDGTYSSKSAVRKAM